MTVLESETTTSSAVRRDPRVVLQSVWIFTMLNYLYCDVLGFMVAEDLQGFLDGNVGGLEITPMFLLGAGMLMEIPIAMVLVSRLAPHKVARIASIAAGAFMALVQVGSVGIGSDLTVHYAFFSVVEIAATVFIVRFAWKWRPVPAVRQA